MPFSASSKQAQVTTAVPGLRPGRRGAAAHADIAGGPT
jgi:hypothetical protein